MVTVRSSTVTPALRSSFTVRLRVMPARKVPLGTGVLTTPFLARKRLELQVSATLPAASSTMPFWKPRASISATPRLELG